MKSKRLLLFLTITAALVPAFFLALLFTRGAAVPAQAAGNNWYANPVIGDNNNSCTTASTPCKTVLGVVNKAGTGDTVHLAAGTYNENSVWVEKDLIIRGAGAETTIVSGNGDQALFLIQVSGFVPVVVIEDITMRNAKDGAIVNYMGGVVTLNRVIVENNINGLDGSTILNLNGSILTVQNSTLRNNTADNGSALRNDGSTVVISNTAVINNSSNDSTLDNQSSGDMTLVNVTVSNNKGDGISQTSDSAMMLTNVTIADNDNYGIINYSASFVIKNSILANNKQNCANGIGNVLPTSQGYNMDTAGSCNFIATGDQSSTNPQMFPLMQYNDMWLRPFTANSPARNKGTNAGCPADDQAGTTRPKEGVCDVGAYEYDPANPPQMKLYLPLVIRP